MSQEASAGDNATIIQAGRDAILQVTKSPPDIRLVRLEISDDHEQGGLRQCINVILKNNGDTTAFMLRGFLLKYGAEEITNCGHMGMQYSLSQADWTYDVDMGEVKPSFKGQHSVGSGEVVNFNVVVGRRRGSYETTVYWTSLVLEFDEGGNLETNRFHIQLAGPTTMLGGYQAQGPTPDQWGRCQADNITRLDRIAFDHRHNIHPDSRKYIEQVAPNIFRT